MKHLFAFLTALCTFAQTFAASTDSIQISLLTVLPRADAVYTVYGHTALRVLDVAQGTDIVYNWGMFNFDAPNFTVRFVQGKTDYSLGATSYDRFIFSYARDNATIVEQMLTFSPEGKIGLLNAIEENYRPENRVYRYSYVFDNCTTRPRDLIEQFGPENLTYKESPIGMTLRKQIQDCTKSQPLMAFGIDLLLGSGIDSLVLPRTVAFLPLRLKEAINTPAQAVIGEQVVIAGLTRNPLKTTAIAFGLAIMLLAIIFFLPRWAISPLYLTVALVGCLLVYMNWFSVHPCVSHNWNLLWLNPLHFFGLVGCFVREKYRVISWYHALNVVLLLLFLLFWAFGWLPQTFEVYDLVLIVPLLVASAIYVIKQRI
ncbi:membrane protein [Bacteroidia bacterium]|nr:membrane protein [Bacteroidia bacterium]